MTTTISSVHNERIKSVRQLQRAKKRKESGRAILEGPVVLEAALSAGIVPEVVFVAEGDVHPEADVTVITVTDNVLDTIAPTETPRGPIAVIAIPEPAPLRRENTVVLWDVADPGNVGTLVRSASAFGWNVAVQSGADPWGPKVLRAGAGAHFDVALSTVGTIDELLDVELHPVATVAGGGMPPEDVRIEGAIALLVGNEASGLPADVVAVSEASVTIPMRGTESLNAAIAGSIVMYAMSAPARTRSDGPDQ